MQSPIRPTVVRLRAALSLSLAVALASCGGGSGGSSPTTSTTSPAFAAEASESAPVGARVDLLAAGYMPFTYGSAWTYSMLDPSGNLLGTATQALANTAGAGAERLLRFTLQENGTTQTSDYTWRADGLYASLADSGVPAGTQARIGDIREYTLPTYAAGETRLLVRAGAWDADLDGDGRFETFRLEYRQRYDGLVPLALPWDASASVARFTSSIRLVIQPSASGARAVGAVTSKQESFALGAGLVQWTERVEDLDGALQEAPKSYMVRTATVGGVTFAAPVVPPVVPVTSIPVVLDHAGLVYDATRNLYYASVRSTATTGANSIATIVPATGAVTYSAPLDAQPDVLAASPDGSFLYVGLATPGQVVKLALPSLTEVSRVTLGTDLFYGTLYAEALAVSPADPDVFAVSRASRLMSPRHVGVALVSGTTILPVMTQVHTGSNQIAFGADGSTLFGLNNETTEFGLRRIAVAADGLREGTVVPTNGPFGIGRLVFAGGQLHVGSHSWNATTLTDSGTFDPQSTLCVPLASAPRVLCRPSFADPQILTVWNGTTFTRQTTLTLPALGGLAVRNVVPGMAARAAVSLGDFSGNTRILLLDDAAL